MCYLHCVVASEAVSLFDRSGFRSHVLALEEGRGLMVRGDTVRAPLLQCCNMKLLRSTVDLYLCEVGTIIAQSCGVDQTQLKIP